MKIRETQILCKLIWGGMRVSGYFVDGGRGKSDPWGIEEGCRLGLWARRLVEPLRLIKLAFWVYWRCLALGEAPGGQCGWWDHDIWGCPHPMLVAGAGPEEKGTAGHHSRKEPSGKDR